MCRVCDTRYGRTDGAAAAGAPLGAVGVIKAAREAAIRGTTNKGRPEAATRGAAVGAVVGVKYSFPTCLGRRLGMISRTSLGNAVK